DRNVTGVQTCALPIYNHRANEKSSDGVGLLQLGADRVVVLVLLIPAALPVILILLILLLIALALRRLIQLLPVTVGHLNSLSVKIGRASCREGVQHGG